MNENPSPKQFPSSHPDGAVAQRGRTSAPVVSHATRLALALPLVLAVAAAHGADAPPANTQRVKQELIEIMKGVNFVPQLGADDPFCKAFYEDFKQQKNIEHIQPIARADRYDDPAFQSYQSKCPKLKMHKHYGFYPRDMELGGPPESEEDAESRAVQISTGLKNFQLFKVDINNHPEDGEEYLFYYEGKFEKRSNRAYPEPRAYQVVDLTACRISDGVYFNQLGSERWSRNGVIRYKGKNGIYVLASGHSEQPSYQSITLWMYSERLKRTAPVCSHALPR